MNCQIAEFHVVLDGSISCEELLNGLAGFLPVWLAYSYLNEILREIDQLPRLMKTFNDLCPKAVLPSFFKASNFSPLKYPLVSKASRSITKSPAK